jgi:tetratricopeptide (TPR) repeat protein
VFGYFDKSIQTVTKAAELCELGDRGIETAFAYGTLAYAQFYKCDFEQTLLLKDKALPKLDEQFDLTVYVRVLSAASAACALLGRSDDATELGLKALEAAQEFSDNRLYCQAMWGVGPAYAMKGELHEAIGYTEMAVSKAPTPGDKMSMQAMLQWLHCRAGDQNVRLDHLTSFVAIVRNAGYVTLQLLGEAWLAEAYLWLGKYDQARQTAEALVELAGRCGVEWYLSWAHRVLGEIALETDPTQAAPHLRKSIEITQKIKSENDLAHAYSAMGRYHKQQGNIADACEYLTKALEIFERLGTLIEPDKVRKELAELPQ